MSESELNEEIAIAKASQESMSLYERVQVLVVKDQESYDSATELYKVALAVEKAVNAAHDPVCNHWFTLHREACANKKKDLDKVVEAKKLSKSKADTWACEQELIRQEAERKAQEEARHIAEEQARIAREAQEVERQRLAAIEEEERMRLAQEAEASGASLDEIDQILETPLPIPEPEPIPEPIIVMPTIAKTFKPAAGFSARTNYTAAVINLAELVKAAAANHFFVQYLQPNESAINSLAKASKEKFSLPGCQLKTSRV